MTKKGAKGGENGDSAVLWSLDPDYIVSIARGNSEAICALLVEYIRSGNPSLSDNLTRILNTLEGSIANALGIDRIELQGTANKFVLHFKDSSTSYVDVDYLLDKYRRSNGKASSLLYDAFRILGFTNSLKMTRLMPTFITTDMLKAMGVKMNRDKVNRHTANFPSGCYVVDRESGTPKCLLSSLCFRTLTVDEREIIVDRPPARQSLDSSEDEDALLDIEVDEILERESYMTINECDEKVVKYVPRPHGWETSENCDSACSPLFVKFADVVDQVGGERDIDRIFYSNHTGSRYTAACMKLDRSAKRGGTGIAGRVTPTEGEAGLRETGGSAAASAAMFSAAGVLLGTSILAWLSSGSSSGLPPALEPPEKTPK